MSAYKLIDNGPAGKHIKTPDERILSISPLAVLDELNRIHAASTAKPEPSRLEIAAMVFAAWQACPDITPGCTVESAVKCADALITAEKEVAK